jgi:hypothetical protein
MVIDRIHSLNPSVHDRAAAQLDQIAVSERNDQGIIPNAPVSPAVRVGLLPSNSDRASFSRALTRGTGAPPSRFPGSRPG